MATTAEQVLAAVVLLTVRFVYCSAQGGCSPPAGILMTGDDKLSGSNVPTILSTGSTSIYMRPKIGGQGADWWTVYSETQVREHGLWCQVLPSQNPTNVVNIGDWYYPPGDTPDGFTLVPTTSSSSVPYQSLKCTHQIGLLRTSSIANNQGIVKCNTTLMSSSSFRTTNYLLVYSDDVFDNYTGPTVDPTMKLFLMTPKEAVSNLDFTLSFTVSYGVPSRLRCVDGNNNNLFGEIASRGPTVSQLSREVIRSHYINSSYPDMTRVSITRTGQPREAATYTCTVFVEGRINPENRNTYNFRQMGNNVTTASITVASAPTSVMASRTGFDSVSVSWTAPSPPAPAIYEVFYQVTGMSSTSGGTTSNTELTLTGLAPGSYSIFVVGSGADGDLVLPSVRSDPATITIDIPKLSSVPTLAPSFTSIMVSWTPTQFTPSSYRVSHSCQLICDLSSVQQDTVNASLTEHTITSIAPGSTCTVSVTAVFGTSIISNMITSSTNTTSAAPTGAPGGLTNTSVESRSLSVVWGTVPCPHQGGPITGYRLRYSNGTSIVDTTVGEESRQHVLTGLTPFTSYSLEVAAVNDGGTGQYSAPLSVETLQDVPGPVSNLSVVPGVVEVSISWNPPSERNGIIVVYELGFLINGVMNFTNTSDTQYTQHTLRDVPPNSAVFVVVRAYTVIGPGNFSNMVTTTMAVPNITLVSVEPVNRTAVNVTWTPLNLPVVDHYTVHYSSLVNGGSGRRRRQSNLGSVTFPANVSSGVVPGLMGGQQYQFSVSVTLSVGGVLYMGDPGTPTDATVPVPPSSTLPPQVTTSTPANNAATHITTTPTRTPTTPPTRIPTTPPPPTVSGIQIGPVAGGAVGAILAVVIVIVIVVIVVIVLRRNKKEKSEYSVHYVKDGPKVDTNEAHYEAVAAGPVVATEPEYVSVTSKPFIESFPEDMTTTEGARVEFPVKVAGDPPPTLTWYHDSTRLDNDYAHEISSNGTLTIVTAEMKHAGNYRLVATNSVGTVEGQFTLKLISETPEAPSSGGGKELSHPVPMAEFGQYVAQNHANTNKGFSALYNSLDSGEEGHGVTVAVSAANKPLNRFNNIIVYDDNRIMLQSISGRADCQRDYINASYIHGYGKEHKFIACQGPLTKTLVDYWRLVWQERVHAIVMVTNLREDKKLKCQQYWPENDCKDFGPFRVTLTDTQLFANFTIRLFQVELLGSSEFPRLVTQYHFTSWPDHGVPEYGTPILAFHRRIKQEYNPSQGPMVVHCSAGVGRTGTFIAIDTILEQVKREGIVDVSGVITKMRQQRMKMVQTAEQYIFIHDVILESVTCGDTQINSGDLRPAIARLMKRNPTTGKTQFESQFEVLNQVTPDPKESKCEAAVQNKTKNRSMDFLPTDKHRVILKQGHPDYINASYVNSYKHKKAFIITQNPMESTSGDFWRMIVERGCRVIVMLCPLQEDGKEVCHQYWPNSRIERHGDFSIEIGRTDQCGGYVERVLSIADKSGKTQTEVTQFQIQNWNSRGKCNPQTIINVVEEVYKVQRRTDNKPIVVHCSDTVSRSGMFCAIATTIDRCKSESVVDVFQVVKAQRIQKPGLVLNVEQYQFVFEAVLTFLESFDTYSNFKC